MTTEPLRIALIGWGAIGRTVGRLLAERDDADRFEVVAVAVRNPRVTRDDLPSGAELLLDPGDLAALQPHVVAEAAGRSSVEPWGYAALRGGADLIVSSVSAFAEPAVLRRLQRAAAASGAQLQIQPGALAGVEALAAARLLGLDRVEHRIVKPPQAWKDTPAEQLCDLDALAAPTAFFRADAAQTAATFPKNANVAMTTALAGIGPEATTISLVADPQASANRHEVTAEGAFGQMQVSVANAPLPDNAKTSALAALSLVRAITNRTDTLVI